MNKRKGKIGWLVLCMVGAMGFAQAQYNGGGDNIPNPNNATNKDSTFLQHRDKYADSITIFYRYFDATVNGLLDSSIGDFYNRIPQSYSYTNLGNFGSATHSLIFRPLLQPGFDAGFHQYDRYNYSIADTRFFQTTRPFTELSYLLGSKAEQIVQVLHTQNRTPSKNFSVEYRFSNAPGTFKTQNASLNNLRLTGHFQSDNKRYELFGIYIMNKNAASENGGLVDVGDLKNLSLNNPYEIETRLGVAGAASRNPFNTTVNTGNIYQTTQLLFRHQYDFGQKDSIVTDSVTYHLFYPRFRVQHTLQTKGSNYHFFDNNVDSAKYLNYFNWARGKSKDTISNTDDWNILGNELSVLLFPDKRNISEFLKIGASYETIKGRFNDTTKDKWQNLQLIGEYRNRTRNNKWDMVAKGQLYYAGWNAGDYAINVSLQRKISQAVGSLQIGADNVLRSPSFIYNPATSFRITNKQVFKKESLTRLSAQYFNKQYGVNLLGETYLINNYLYFDSFFTARQSSAVVNVWHINAQKQVRLNHYFNWYIQLDVQQANGDAPVHVPSVLTQQRIAFEGNFYTNLFLSTGFEMRYYTNYKADNYSPFTGQFFYQDGYMVKNTPDINFFFNFRIKSFKGFGRVENLNTLNTAQGLKFNNNNINTQQYPNQGVWLRFGVWWGFVN